MGQHARPKGETSVEGSARVVRVVLAVRHAVLARAMAGATSVVDLQVVAAEQTKRVIAALPGGNQIP